ncbi:MAG: serine hydrolase domain-containing protein [Pseudomonadota bacterium]
MERLQTILVDAVTEGQMPFSAGLVFTSDGVVWQGCAGDVAERSVFRLYSMTKIVGALGTALLVERGHLAWDAPVGDILPEFDALPVLDGWEGDTPLLRPQATKARFSDLACHMSGSAYPLWHAGLMRYFKERGERPPESGAAESWSVPLASDPGATWAYGYGPDWLGLAIERITGQKLPEFFAAEVFGPLGAESLSFTCDPKNPALAASFRRMPDGNISPFPAAPPVAPEVYGMGNALFGTLPDFAKLLSVVLRGRAPLLSAHNIAELLSPKTPHLPPMQPQAWPSEKLELPGPVTHTLAAMRTETDWPTGRAAGSLFWAGLLNSHYWIDPKRGLGGIFATQMLPFADQDFMRVYTRFETEVYEGFEQKS